MATKSILLTFADANEADIVAALKAEAVSNGLPTPTKAQAWDWFEAQCKATLREIVKSHRRALASKAADDTPLDVT